MAKSIFILLAFILIVFYPCLNAEFINLDDAEHIVANPAVQELNLSSIKLAFTQTVNKTYIPLTTLSFSIEKYFFGFNKFVFHLDNILIFDGVVILVFLLARSMGLSLFAGFLAALIFAVHPMRVETVAWVTERKDVLYSLFYLLALLNYWPYLKTLSIKNYLLTAFFGFLSILTKPMALSLPLILLVLDWYYGRRFSKRVLLEKIPIFFYIIPITWLTVSLNMHHSAWHLFPQGVLILFWSFAFYIWKFFLPFQLFPYYVLPHPISISNGPYLLSVALCLGVVFLLFRFNKNKLFVFAFLYFFFSIFFLLRIDNNSFNEVADRFMLLPSLGLCFFLGEWAEKCITNRWCMIVFYSLLVLMGIRTNMQCQIWHDSITFWNAVIEEYPGYYRAYNNRGSALFQQGHDDLALSDFNRAIAIEPRAVKAYNNRGFVYFIRKEDDKALADYNKALSLDPTFAGTYMNLSLLMKADKNYFQALQYALHAKQLGLFVDEAYIKRLQQTVNASSLK